jgi:hypothetical protein
MSRSLSEAFIHAYFNEASARLGVSAIVRTFSSVCCVLWNARHAIDVVIDEESVAEIGGKHGTSAMPTLERATNTTTSDIGPIYSLHKT